MIHVNSEVRSFFVSFGYMKNVSRNSNNLTKTKNIFKINLKGGIPKRKSLVLKLPDVKLNNYFNQILNRQRFEVSVSIFNSESYIECLTCYVVVCLQGGKKSTLIFHEEEISLRILPENLNCFVHHLCEGGVHGWITVQLVAAVFRLKET